MYLKFFRYLALALIALTFQEAGFGQVQVQFLSDSAKISLMTVAPGQELYSSFGHSALRINDPLNGMDRCYNYGTFDFDQPNFYVNFCRGKLLYSLDLEPARYFLRSNLQDGRPMREQVLNLTPQERQSLYELLQTNALPENKDYKYDFFYDNCATRIRDIVQKNFGGKLHFDTTKLTPNTSMRDLLRPYTRPNPWTEFGIDLVLGLPTDKKARAQDFMFLPDGLHDQFAAATTPSGAPLVIAERPIPDAPLPQRDLAPGLLGRPSWVLLFIALIGLASMMNARASRIFDSIFWFVLGLAGLIMALLWFATDHTATKVNFNLLWALPTHLLVFWRSHRTGWVRKYFLVTAVLAGLALVCWKFIPQEMPVAAIPIILLVIILAVRGKR